MYSFLDVLFVKERLCDLVGEGYMICLLLAKYFSEAHQDDFFAYAWTNIFSTFYIHSVEETSEQPFFPQVSGLTIFQLISEHFCSKFPIQVYKAFFFSFFFF